MPVVKVAIAALGLLVGVTAASAAAPLRPLVQGWEQWFRIDSEVTNRAGASMVRGTVWNTSTWPAKRIQLLVEGLDAGGQPVSQRDVWLGPDLPSGGHAFFEAPAPPSVPAAVSYRVSVFAFDSARGRWG